jgi:hypothetical protein
VLGRYEAGLNSSKSIQKNQKPRSADATSG